MIQYDKIAWQTSNISSQGQFPKAEYTGKVHYYLKLSNCVQATVVGYESVLKVIASRLGITLGLPVLKYTGKRTTVVVHKTVQ